MLQNFPLYAYIPAKDVARARRFYESKLGYVLLLKALSPVADPIGAMRAVTLVALEI